MCAVSTTSTFGFVCNESFGTSAVTHGSHILTYSSPFTKHSVHTLHMCDMHDTVYSCGNSKIKLLHLLCVSLCSGQAGGGAAVRPHLPFVPQGRGVHEGKRRLLQRGAGT